jgi:uncharacterized protein (TIGR02594 family)
MNRLTLGRRSLSNKIYHVRRTDTLSQIARLAGIDLDDLLAINPQISDPDRIRPGQAILLPAAVSRRTLLAKAAEAVPGNEPLWLKVARRELGMSADPDPNESNPVIVEYLTSVQGLPPAMRDSDETAWCAAFTNWCFETSGVLGRKSARALAWNDWGREVQQPSAGCLVVFRREHVTNQNDRGGHVGFYLYGNGANMTILGGNQASMVCEMEFPMNGQRGSYNYEFLSFRVPGQ